MLSFYSECVSFLFYSDFYIGTGTYIDYTNAYFHDYGIIQFYASLTNVLAEVC